MLQFGRFVRLRSPFEGDGNETAWMSVSDDARHAVVGWYRVLSRPEPGLAIGAAARPGPGAHATGCACGRRRTTPWSRRNASVRGGDDLMRAGLFLDDGARESAVRGDFQARLFELEAI